MNPDEVYESYVAANPHACERCYEEQLSPWGCKTSVVVGEFGPYVTCGKHEGDPDG